MKEGAKTVKNSPASPQNPGGCPVRRVLRLNNVRTHVPKYTDSGKISLCCCLTCEALASIQSLPCCCGAVFSPKTCRGTSLMAEIQAAAQALETKAHDARTFVERQQHEV